MIEIALHTATNRKYAIFPLHSVNPDQKLCSCGDPNCENQGKHPRTEHGLDDATSAPDQIRKWWERWGNANIGIPCSKNYIAVLDIDPRHEGDKSLAKLEARYGKLPNTFTVRTGGSGLHFYFSRFAGEKLKSVSNALGPEYPGIDLKSDGGYVVGPGSLHLSGNRYEIIKDVDLVDIPEGLEKLLINQGKSEMGARKESFKLPETIPDGKRNQTLVSFASSLRAKGADEGEILAGLQAINRRCTPPYPEDKLRVIAANRAKKDVSPSVQRDTPASDLYTQIKIADQFIEGHLDTWRYNVDRKQWFFWTGKVWESDEGEQVKNVDKEFLKEYLSLVPTMQVGKGIVDLTKFIVSLNTSKGIRDILSIAAPGMTIRDQDLDKEQYYLNCQNGTLDLKSGMLREHNRDDFCARITNTDYVSGADCPLWKKHIETILEDNKSLIDSVQELLGYSLFLGNPDAVFTVFFGSGRNGKSVSLEVISHILGGYAVSVSPVSFMAEGDRAGSDRIRMRGARLITASEPADSSKKRCELDTGFIKTASGNDPVSARRLYCEGTTFKVLGLVVLSTNALPKIHDPTIAIWDRLWCVPFNHYFMPEDRDKDIADKLIAEGPGILNWLKAGYDRYQVKTRLIPCEAITKQTEEYRRDEDFFTPFFDSGSVSIEKNAKIQASRLYSLYETWFKLIYKEDRKPASLTKFGRDMSMRFRKEKGTVIFYLGIGESGQQKVSS